VSPVSQIAQEIPFPEDLSVHKPSATIRTGFAWAWIWADSGLPTSNHPPKTGEWLKTRAAGLPTPTSRAIEFSTTNKQRKTSGLLEKFFIFEGYRLKLRTWGTKTIFA
jgi:hypothetical protein